MQRNYNWLNHNSFRSYPLREDTNLTFNTGTSSYNLDSDIILDMLIVHNHPHFLDRVVDEVEQTLELRYEFLIYKIDSASTSVVFYVKGVPNEGDDKELGSFTCTRSSNVQEVDLSDNYGIGIFQNVDSIPRGIWESSSTYLEARIIRNNPLNRVTSIEIGGTTYTGEVTFKEGYNIQLSTSDGVIEVSAGLGYGEGEFCGDTCPEPDACDTALYGLNGVLPDDNGNILVIPEKYVDVETGTNGIVISAQVDDTNICTRTGTPGETGPSGPTGGGGARGEDVEPEVCVGRYCTKTKIIRPTDGYVVVNGKIPKPIWTTVPTACCKKYTSSGVYTGSEAKQNNNYDIVNWTEFLAVLKT